MSESLAHVVILLGSNQGDSVNYIARACQFIQENIGKIVSQSVLYKSKAWGNTQQNDFINQCILVQTQLSAQQTLTLALAIEERLGRIRKERWGPRLIDIDLLDFDRQVVNQSNLTLPHPYIQDRRFTLLPLAEILPHWLHPISGKNINTLIDECPDTLVVEKL